jgi:flagellar biosynthesis anti-sigma factor FlgM
MGRRTRTAEYENRFKPRKWCTGNPGRAGWKGPPQLTPAAAGEPGFAENNSSVGKLAAAALNVPDVRQAKVAALRAQLAAGNYKVSSQQVAGALLEQMRVRVS